MQRLVTDTGTTFRRRLARASVACSKLVALLAMVIFWASATAGATTEINAYKLAPGDRITVAVIGHTDLSGNFPVDLTGNVLLPLIGSVDVRNLTVAESQRRIAQRFADGIINKPSVFVTIAEVRPIQVLGNVKTPGSYPYRHGTLVKSAIAQAGGFGLAGQNQAEGVAKFLRADERVRVLAATRQRLLIRHARLTAQLDGDKTFMPRALPGPTNDRQTTRLIAEEKKALDIQSDGFERQLALIRALEPKLIAERESIDRLIKSEEKQVQLIQQQIDDYNKLVKKGLGRSKTVIDYKLGLASKESNVWRLKVDRSRIRVNIEELKIRLRDKEASYKTQILTKLSGVRERLHDVEVTLPSACEVREAELQQVGHAIGSVSLHDLSITRFSNTGVSTFQAKGTTLLEPGDIVEVSALRRRGSQSGAASDETKLRKSQRIGWCTSTVDQVEWSSPNSGPLVPGKG